MKPVADHVEDYLAACRFEGMGLAFERIKRSQLRRLVEHAGARRLAHLTPDGLSAYLQTLKEQGRSNRTINQHRATAVAFANWCVKERRLELHALDRVPRLNEEVGRKRVRRAATEDELRRFLDAAPPERRFRYAAALHTGLRRGELKAIERRDIDLDAGTLTVRAEVSKSGRSHVLPLHQELLKELANRIAGLRPNDRVFIPVPTIRTFKRDLERAGIPFRDENGRQLDFHALRATFATRLLRQGVPSAVARQLTRHASVRTLEKHYDRIGLADAVEAMRKLPGVNFVNGDAGSQRSSEQE